MGTDRSVVIFLGKASDEQEWTTDKGSYWGKCLKDGFCIMYYNVIPLLALDSFGYGLALSATLAKLPYIF